MSVSLVLPGSISEELGEMARDPFERAAVLIARAHLCSDNAVRLLGRELVPVTEAAYRERSEIHMAIASEGFVPALGQAEAMGSMAIWVHTHPGEQGVPLPSAADHAVDAAVADVFRLRADSSWYGTMIVSPRGEGFVFSGTLQAENEPPTPIERLWSVGERWHLQTAVDIPGGSLAPMYDRNVRAFGGEVQRALGDLRVAVVGCGGTGSAVAEQLVRLGIRKLVLVDADHLSASNVTRVWGSRTSDVSRPKAEVLRDHLCAIVPDLDSKAVRSMITLEPAARMLAEQDLVFGCTDDNAGRLVLSRLASYFLTPVIDLGVLLSSDGNGTLTGIDGRVTILSPGSACLVCRDRIDLARASAEMMTPAERKKLADEGYAPALPGTEPAVIAFTTAVAAAAVTEMLERMTGYGPDPRPSEILLRFHDREVSTNTAVPRPGHYCDPASGKLGAAALAPFLEQVWPG